MKTIILVTYTISPYKGSESLVSWNYVCNMQDSQFLQNCLSTPTTGGHDRKLHFAYKEQNLQNAPVKSPGIQEMIERQELCNDTTKLSAMSSRASRKITDELVWDKASERFIELYRNVSKIKFSYHK